MIRGGSRGRVQGVRTPPLEKKLSSSIYMTYSLLKSFYLMQSVTSFLRGAPLLRKILDPPLMIHCIFLI